MTRGGYYYEFQIGTAEFSRFGLDDRSARVLLNRWLSVFWDSFKPQYPGSIRHHINNHAPTAMIVRRWCERADLAIIPCVNPTVVERFTLSDESRAEFNRLYRR